MCMVIRSVQGEALRNAIHEEALQNAGFLYLQNPDTISEIKKRYKESEGSSSRKYKSEASEEDIHVEMETLLQRSHVTEVHSNEVYFFNPYELPGDETSSLNTILERLFKTKRYHTEVSIVESLRRANIRIAEDDLHLFIEQLESRDLLFQLENGTKYYRPGTKLREKSNLKEVSDILADGVGSDGCLTRDGIGRALDIEEVEDKVVDDLKDRHSAIYDLGDEYVVNEPDCKEKYASALVERGLKRELEEKFKTNDWAITEGQLKTKIENEASSFLSAVDDRPNMYYKIRDKLINELNLSKSTPETSDINKTIYVMERNFDEMVNRDAIEIKESVKKAVNNENPESMPTVIEEYASFKSYGSDPQVNLFIQRSVEEEVRSAIDRDDEINVWQSIGD